LTSTASQIFLKRIIPQLTFLSYQIPFAAVHITFFTTHLLNMMKISLIAALCFLAQVHAFAPNKGFVGEPRPMAIFGTSPKVDDHSLADVLSEKRGFLASSVGGLVTGLSSCVAAGMAVEDYEYEIAQLPPTWVPAVFGIFLVAGVGVLTASLGNVMDEGKIRISSQILSPFARNSFFISHRNDRGSSWSTVGSKSQKRNRKKSIFVFQKEINESLLLQPGKVIDRTVK
jgi:hypothetical protein